MFAPPRRGAAGGLTQPDMARENEVYLCLEWHKYTDRSETQEGFRPSWVETVERGFRYVISEKLRTWNGGGIVHKQALRAHDLCLDARKWAE